jgi:ketosteroid isomerase-like protein
MTQVRAASGILVAALAGGVLSGCGPFGESEKGARDTLTELIEARNARDFERVCDLLAEQQLQKFRRADTNCEEQLSARASDVTIRLRIDEVRVSGDRATVNATVGQEGQAGQAQTVLLVKEDGDWKVSQVGF